MASAGTDPEWVSIPYPIGRAVAVAVFASAYVTLLNCHMSDPSEVFLGILAGIFSFTALAGQRTKLKLLVGSFLTGGLYFIPYPVIKAVCIGFLQGYLQTATEIYVSHLALRSFRSEAVGFMNLLFTMQMCVMFFLLSFLPMEGLVRSVVFMILTIIAQVLAIFFWLPTPPIETVNAAADTSAMLYGQVYTKLTALFDKAPFSHFHAEYAEIVDLKNGKPVELKTKLWAILEKINISFVTVGIQGVLSVEGGESSAYLVIYAASTMFVWMYAHRRHDKHLEVCILGVGAVLLMVSLIYQVRPSFVFAMACSIYLVPSREGFLAQNAVVIACCNSIRSLLGAGIFYLLNGKTLH